MQFATYKKVQFEISLGIKVMKGPIFSSTIRMKNKVEDMRTTKTCPPPTRFTLIIPFTSPKFKYWTPKFNLRNLGNSLNFFYENTVNRDFILGSWIYFSLLSHVPYVGNLQYLRLIIVFILLNESFWKQKAPQNRFL